MIGPEECSALFECIKKGESVKAMTLLDSITDKIGIKPYADAYTAVLITETLKQLNIRVSGFYADENEFISMLFDGDEARQCRRTVIYALCEKARSAREISRDEAMKKAENYIKECYCDVQLSEGLLCDMTGLSAVTLTGLFKKKYNMGVAEYISRYRLGKSIELLEQSELTLDVIAEMTGFCETETYSRTFKRFYHVTPGKFRAAAKK